MPHRRKKGAQWLEAIWGDLKRYHVPNPAVATDWSFTVPQNKIWKVLTVTFRLVTDANVATRIVAIRSKNGNLVDFITTSAEAHLASLTRDYSMASHSNRTTSSNAQVMVPSPPDLFVLDQDVIETNTAALQAGDQFSNIIITIMEWDIDSHEP